MDLMDVQRILFATKDYLGPIDNLRGDGTDAAMATIEKRRARDYPEPPSTLPMARRLVAAGQAGLNALGHQAGAADGLVGHNTQNALEAFDYKRRTGTDLRVSRNALKARPDPEGIPTQAECASYYGDPARGEVAPRLVTVQSPYPLRLDWDLDTTTNKLRLHRRAAPSLVEALRAVLADYGLEEIQRLGLDRYAGGYNHRSMRGGTKWSMHAYGCAVDFYAAPNGLRTRCPNALFCGAEYQPFLDIMGAHGWLPAIRLWGADGMHFQRARL